MSRTIAKFMCLTLIYFTHHANANQNTDPTDAIFSQIKRVYGVALINLSVEVSNASIEIERSPEYKVKAELVANSGDFLALRLPKGKYRIKTVNIPYFDLPYKLDGGYSGNYWDFEVKAGHINYVGELIIREQRAKQSVDVNLINRIAKDYASIKTQFENYLTHYPLINNRLNGDDFYQLYITGGYDE